MEDYNWLDYLSRMFGAPLDGYAGPNDLGSIYPQTSYIPPTRFRQMPSPKRPIGNYEADPSLPPKHPVRYRQMPSQADVAAANQLASAMTGTAYIPPLAPSSQPAQASPPPPRPTPSTAMYAPQPPVALKHAPPPFSSGYAPQLQVPRRLAPYSAPQPVPVQSDDPGAKLAEASAALGGTYKYNPYPELGPRSSPFLDWVRGRATANEAEQTGWSGLKDQYLRGLENAPNIGGQGWSEMAGNVQKQDARDQLLSALREPGRQPVQEPPPPPEQPLGPSRGPAPQQPSVTQSIVTGVKDILPSYQLGASSPEEAVKRSRDIDIERRARETYDRPSNPAPANSIVRAGGYYPNRKSVSQQTMDSWAPTFRQTDQGRMSIPDAAKMRDEQVASGQMSSYQRPDGTTWYKSK